MRRTTTKRRPSAPPPGPRVRRWLGLLLAFCALPALAEPYLIGAEDDWYPYTALRGGVVRGMSADIVREAFEAAGVPVKLVAYPYARCMHMAERGELAGCFNTAPNADLLQRFLVSPPLFQGEILLWARRDNAQTLKNLDALRGRPVAAVIGFEYGPAFDAREDLNKVPVRREINGFLMLARGRVNYFPAYRGTAEQLFRERPALQGLFVPVARLLRTDLHLSFSRHIDNAGWLRERFAAGLRTLHDNGEYAAILQRWQHHLPDSGPTLAQPLDDSQPTRLDVEDAAGNRQDAAHREPPEVHPAAKPST